MIDEEKQRKLLGEHRANFERFCEEICSVQPMPENVFRDLLEALKQIEQENDRS